MTSLPYWNTEDEFPCTYAGTFNVSLDDTMDHNLFYWLFKNTSFSNAPLVLWINGGPGATSMTGLFLENGPLRVDRNGTSSNDFIIGLSKTGSWLEAADVVYLD